MKTFLYYLITFLLGVGFGASVELYAHTFIAAEFRKFADEIHKKMDRILHAVGERL